MKPITINPGDEFEVDFLKNRNGGAPIAKVEGIVSFLSDQYKERIELNSSYIVQVVKVNEKSLIINPLIQLRTAKENEALLKQKLSELKNSQGKPHKQKPDKVKTKFKYLSKNEMSN